MKHLTLFFAFLFSGMQVIAQAPVINSFTPTSGLVGSTVTITGANFDGTTPANNQVFFGSAEATVLTSSFGTLTVSVPGASTTNLISVRNATNGLTGYARNHFNGLFCDTPLDNTTYGTFNPTVNGDQEMTGVYGAYNIDIYDIDGDGKSDIITGKNDGGLTIAHNQSTPGTMNFVRNNINTLGYNVQQFFVADYDGDGKRDILISGADGMHVFRNLSTPGTISFSGRIFVTSGNFYQCAAGDLDGDGKIDIVGGIGNYVYFYKNNSTGPGSISFSYNTLRNTGSRPNGLQVVDVDGDGQADVVGTHRSLHRIFALRNTTTGSSFTFAGTQVFSTVRRGPYRLKLGDFDKDGNIDLVMPLYEGARTCIFRNSSTSGSISFDTPLLLGSTANNYRVGVGDVNGDGFPDIVTKPNGIGALFQVYKNVSTGPGTLSFNNAVTYYTAAGSEVGGIAIGDMDGDFVPDIATSGISSNKIRFHRNTSSAADTDAPTAICKDIVVALDPTGNVTVTGAMIDDGSGDACGLAPLLIDGAASVNFTCSDIGSSVSVLRVTDLAGNTAECNATITIAPAAIIVAGQTTVCQGETITMTANVGDSYQWYKDGVAISGATSQQYIVTETGSYTVQVVNVAGCSGISDPLVATVNENPTVNISPAGVAYLCQPSNTAVLTASASSIYQWYKDGVLISGATNQTYTANSTGDYSVEVIDLFGCSAVSDPVTVAVNPPEIDLTEGAVNITSGGSSDYGNVLPNINYTKTFTISNTGTNNLEVNQINITGPDAASFTLSGLGLPVTIGPSSSATFDITFNDAAITTYNATVSIINNDCDESNYTFDLEAEITCVGATFTAAPGNLAVNTDSGLCSSVVSYNVTYAGTPSPDLTYTFSGATTGGGNGSGSGETFNEGITTVTLLLVNPCSANSMNFTIAVSDNEDPVIIAQGDINTTTSADGIGNCTVLLDVGVPYYDDNCPVITHSWEMTGAVVDSGTGYVVGNYAFPAGVTNIIYYAYDGSSNSASDVMTVTVSDNEAPVICDIPSDITVSCDNIPAIPSLSGSCGSGSSPPVGSSCSAGGASIQSPYCGQYQMLDLGSVPGLPTPYGGVNILFSDNNKLLIGGAANGASGSIYEVGVQRDANNHIVGFTGSATIYATGGYNNGGLSYGPGNVLFHTRYPVNELAQIKAGSSLPDKITQLTPLGVSSSVGGMSFVPAGWPGAGQLKVVSYNTGRFYSLNYTPDGSGTFDINSATLETTIPGGPEGVIYVPPSSPIFPSYQKLLVCEYGSGVVAAYDVNSNGDPIPSTRQSFITGLSGVEGGVIDPVSGDFLFSTFGGGNKVIAVSGFSPPTPGIGATDNCDPAPSINFQETTANGSCPNSYTITRTWTATDVYNNQSTDSQTITVIDQTKPVVTCPTTISVNNDQGVCEAVVNFEASATDNCGTPSITYSQNPGTSFPVGTTSVTATADDGCGNIDACSFTVTVEDNTAPVALCQNVTILLDSMGNSIVDPTMVLQYNPVGYSPRNVPLTSTISTGFDASDLSQVGYPFNTYNTNVWPVGNNFNTPTINLGHYMTWDMVVPVGTEFSKITYSKRSYFGAGPTQASIRTSLDGFASDVTIVSVNSSGNQTIDFDVSSLGLVSGTITFRLYFYGASGYDWADLVSTSSGGTGLSVFARSLAYLVDAGSNDECGIETIDVNPGSFTCSDVGPNTVTLTVTDVNGIASNCAAIVTVEDNINPDIDTEASNQTVECNGSGNNAELNAWLNSNGGAAASDACGYEWSNDFGVLSNGCGDTGSSTVTFTATDPSGNSSQTTATFTIEDTTAPSISCPANIETCADQDLVSGAVVGWMEPTPTDVCGSASAVSDLLNGGVYSVGITTVTYTATDDCGLTSQCNFNIEVWELPEVDITESELPVYCQENSKILSANVVSNTGGITYSWDTGSTTDTIHVQASGVYNVEVTDSNGCTRGTSYNVTVVPQNLLSAYTIIGEDDVHLHGNNVVLNGGVGVLDDKGKAKVHDESFVTGATTFVQSDKIELDNDSDISTEILTPSTVSLPPFYANLFDSDNDVTVDKNTTVTLTEQVYGKIDVKEGSTVIFTQTDLYIEDLKTKEDVTLKFPACAFVRVEKNLNFYKNVTVNPDGHQVQFYVDYNVEVKEGSLINASIDARGHNMNVKGKDDNPTFMNGQFIGKKIHGSKYVTWDWGTACDPGCEPGPDPLLITCECSGGMSSVTVDYSGGTGAGLTSNDGTVTDNGDGTYTISNGGAKLEKNLEVYDGSNTGQMHTSCSQDILGQTFDGEFTVVAHTDMDNETSTVVDCAVLIACECSGGMSSVTVDYSGGTGAGLTSNDGTVTDNGDGTYTISNGGVKLEKNLEVYDGSNTGEMHTSCSQDILGQTFDGVFTVVAHTDMNNETSTVADCPNGVDRQVVVLNANAYGDLSKSQDSDIEINTEQSENITEARIYPNPTTGRVTLDLNSEKDIAQRLMIYDTRGKLIMDQTVNLVKGYNSKNIDMSAYQSGLYFIRFGDLPMKRLLLMN